MEEKENCINVAVRVRPTIKREINDGCIEYWKVEDNDIYLLNDDGSTSSDNKYTFDYIFDMTKKNEDVYQIVKPIVKSAIEGINGTVFAYGQTSSGKTHTIMGNATDKGIIPLAIDDIFRIIENDNKRKYLLRSSYIEIYNERILDLLNKQHTNLKIREDTSGLLSIANCTEEITRSNEELLDVIIKGNKKRQIFSTDMNMHSSRSHVIFKLVIESSSNDDAEGVESAVQVSQLYFVDLAGSERVAQTKATGVRLKEGGHINKSLTVLSMVIRQLSENVNHINFRDSKLTRLLSNALGGNCKTLVIAAITPVSIEDTQSTLMFAKTAKKIKTKPRVNKILTNEAVIKQHKQKEKQLINQLEEERNKNIDLEKDQSMKDKRIKDLEQQIKSIQLNYVTTKIPLKVNTRRHTLGFERPNFSEYSKIPLPVIVEEIKSTDFLVPLSFNPAIDLVGRCQSPEIMEVSESESACSTPKEVLRERYISLNESHAELKQFNLLEFELELSHSKNEVEGLNNELDSVRAELEAERSKSLSNEEACKRMAASMDKLQIQNSEMEISIESMKSRSKMRETELLTLIRDQQMQNTKKDSANISMNIRVSGESDPKEIKYGNKMDKELQQQREEIICLEAELLKVRTENRRILEDNAKMKFRESLWKTKVLRSPQKRNCSVEDLSTIGKNGLRKAVSDSSIFLTDAPTIVRSMSSPNIKNKSIGSSDLSEELFEDLRKGFTSLQSLLIGKADSDGSGISYKNNKLESHIEQGYLQMLHEKNSLLENKLHDAIEAKELACREHLAKVKTLTKQHTEEIKIYENIVKEIRENNENGYPKHMFLNNEEHNLKINDVLDKLTAANRKIDQLELKLGNTKEELNEANEVRKQEEESLIQKLNVLKDKLDMRDKEVALLTQASVEQKIKASRKVEDHERILQEMLKTNKENLDEINRLQELLQVSQLKLNEANISSETLTKALEGKLEVIAQSIKEHEEKDREIELLWNKLKEITSLENELHNLNQTLKVELNRLCKLESDIENERKNNANVVQEHNFNIKKITGEFQSQIDNIKDEASKNLIKVNKELDYTNEEMQQLQNKLTQIQLKLNELNTENANLTKECDELKKQEANLSNDIIIKNQEIVNLKEESSSFMDQVNSLKCKLKEANLRHEELLFADSTEIKKLKSDLLSVRNVLESDNYKNEDLIKKSIADEQHYKQEILAKDHLIEKLNDQIQEIESKLNDAQLKLDETELEKLSMITDRDREIETLGNAFDECKTKLQSFSELEQELLAKDQIIRNLNDQLQSHFTNNTKKTTEDYEEIKILRKELADAHSHSQVLVKNYEEKLRNFDNNILIQNYKEQLLAYESKLKAVNVQSENMLLEYSSQVNQLEQEIKSLKNQLDLGNQRFIQLQEDHSIELEKMHKECKIEMNSLPEDNSKSSVTEIMTLKELHEAQLINKSKEILCLKDKLKEISIQQETTSNNYIDKLNKMNKTLRDNEEKYKQHLKELREQYSEQLSKSTDIHNIYSQPEEQNNETLIKEYVSKIESLEELVLNQNVQLHTANKNIDTMTKQYLLNIQKMSEEQREQMQALRKLHDEEKTLNNISTMKQQFEHDMSLKDNDIIRLKDELNVSLKMKQQFEDSIKLKDKDIIKLKDELSVSLELKEQTENNLALRDKKIIELKEELNVLFEMRQQFENNLTLRDKEIIGLKEELNVLSEMRLQFENNIKLSDMELIRFKEQLGNLSEMKQQLENVIILKDKDINTLKDELNAVFKMRQQFENNINIKDKEIIRLKDELNATKLMVNKVTETNVTDEQKKQYEFDLHILQAKIANIRNINEQYKRTIQELEKGCATKDRELTNTSDLINDLSKKNQDLRDENDSLKMQLSDMLKANNLLNSVNAENSHLMLTLESKTNILLELEARLELRENLIIQNNETIKCLNDKNSALIFKCNEIHDDLIKLQKYTKALEAELNNEKLAKSQLENDRDSLKNNLNHNISISEQLNKKIALLKLQDEENMAITKQQFEHYMNLKNTDIIRLKDELETAKSKVNKTDEQKKQYELELHILQSKVANTRNINEQYRKTIQELQKNCAAKDRQITNTSAIADDLSKKNHVLQEENDALQLQISENRSPNNLINRGTESLCRDHETEIQRLKDNNRSLVNKMNEIRRVLAKLQKYAKNLEAELKDKKQIETQLQIEVGHITSEQDALKKQLDDTSKNMEEKNMKNSDLQSKQKPPNNNLKLPRVEAKVDEPSPSKIFQESVKERRQSLHDQRRHIEPCDNCSRSEKNTLLTDEVNDSMALEDDVRCVEILVKNFNRFVTKEADKCKHCSSLLNYLHIKILDLSKTYQQNHYPLEGTAENIDEISTIIKNTAQIFQTLLQNNDSLKSILMDLDNVKSKFLKFKDAITNKKRYVEDVLRILSADCDVIKQIYFYPNEKSCPFYDSNKLIAGVFIQVKDRLLSSSQYKRESDALMKERIVRKLTKIDNYLREAEVQLVQNLPCSVDLLDYRQLVVKYVALKALCNLRNEKGRNNQNTTDGDQKNLEIAEMQEHLRK